MLVNYKLMNRVDFTPKNRDIIRSKKIYLWIRLPNIFYSLIINLPICPLGRTMGWSEETQTSLSLAGFHDSPYTVLVRSRLEGIRPFKLRTVEHVIAIILVKHLRQLFHYRHEQAH